MFYSGGVFKRNRRLLWLVIIAFVLLFILIQVTKIFTKPHSNYGEIAECDYTHQAAELETPKPTEQTPNRDCYNKNN